MGEVVKTGIAGLDAMLYGGIPKNNQVIIAGGPGVGKTLLAFEILYKNAKMGNTGVFFAFEEEPSRIIENAKTAFPQFTDIDELLKSKKLIIDGQDPSEGLRGESDGSNYEFGKMVSDIESIVTGEGATRVVIDSASVLDILVKDPSLYRRSLLSLVTNFRRIGITSILTNELPTLDRSKLEFRPEYFIFDGILTMYQMEQERRKLLAIEIIKMRGTKHSFVSSPYDIGSSGFKVFAAEDVAGYS